MLCCVQFLKRDQAVAGAGSKEGAILYSLINGAQLNNSVWLIQIFVFVIAYF